MRIVLFDIDGTLILTGGAGLVALRRIFRELHDVEDAAAGIEFHGLTDPVILDNIAARHLGRPLTPAERTRIVDAYTAALPETLARATGYRVLPGVLELLEALGRRGDVALGLATGNFEPTARAKLRHGDLDRFFDWGGFATDSADRAELTRIAVQRGRERAGADAGVWLVGDTAHDVHCARLAGASCLAVATGNATVEELRLAGADRVVASLDAPEAARALGVDGAGPAPR